MPTFFSLKELKTEAFAVNAQRHTCPDGIEWRRLNTVNLQWAETAVSKGLEKPDADNEKLGLAILFYHRIRAILLPKEFPREDLREDHFGPHEGDF